MATCPRTITPIYVKLDISSQAMPVGVLVTIPEQLQGTDWLTLKCGLANLGGSASGGSLGWRVYPAAAIANPGKTLQLSAGYQVQQSPRAGGTFQYQWIEEWGVVDNFFVEITGVGASPAASTVEFWIGGFDRAT